MSLLKKVEELTVDDLQAFPVWEYTNSHEAIGETIVRPVKTTPVKSLTGRVVGTQVRLANGSAMWALLGNVDATNPRLTQHFLTLSVFADGRRFTMARYFDFDSDVRGPHALSAFLRLPIDSVFPISYDVGGYCVGQRAALVGTIETEPRERLTRAEIIALAIPLAPSLSHPPAPAVMGPSEVEDSASKTTRGKMRTWLVPPLGLRLERERLTPRGGPRQSAVVGVSQDDDIASHETAIRSRWQPKRLLQMLNEKRDSRRRDRTR